MRLSHLERLMPVPVLGFQGLLQRKEAQVGLVQNGNCFAAHVQQQEWEELLQRCTRGSRQRSM